MTVAPEDTGTRPRRAGNVATDAGATISGLPAIAVGGQLAAQGVRKNRAEFFWQKTSPSSSS